MRATSILGWPRTSVAHTWANRKGHRQELVCYCELNDFNVLGGFWSTNSRPGTPGCSKPGDMLKTISLSQREYLEIFPMNREDPAEQLGLSFRPTAAAPRRVWMVRELVSAARTALEREYSDIWVEGEISNYRPAESGHLYFTIKDGDAQLKVVMFKTQARLLRFKPVNGMQVIVRGRVTIYESRGELQIYAEFLEPKGAGALQVAFEQLKKKLADEGLFDAAHKKPLPVLPRCIGIITSARGAALRDILNVLGRRHAGVSVLIYPAQVQGEAAPGEVTTALKYFNRTRNVDVIIVARGGGSIEDLAAFNDEVLARAIFASKIPVISAVGHETDFTLADFVAEHRAPTPSAAAEIVVQSRQILNNIIVTQRERMVRAVRFRLLSARNQLHDISQLRTVPRMRYAITRRQQRLDDATYRVTMAQRRILHRCQGRVDVAAARLAHHDLRRVLEGMRRGFKSASERFALAVRGYLRQKASHWERVHGRMETLSPLKILDRGYALVFDAQGKLLREASQVRPGEIVSARLARGSIDAEVKKTKDGI